MSDDDDTSDPAESGDDGGEAFSSRDYFKNKKEEEGTAEEEAPEEEEPSQLEKDLASNNEGIDSAGDAVDRLPQAIEAAIPDEVKQVGTSVLDGASRIADSAVLLRDRLDMFGITTACFSFVIDGKLIGAFESLSGMQVSYEPFEIEEGGNNHSTVKRPGRMHWDNLVLRRGISMIDTLFDWINQASGDGFSAENTIFNSSRTLRRLKRTTGQNMFNAQTGALTLVSPLGVPLRAWWVREALPVRWKGPDFSARTESGNESVPCEELEIAHEGLETISLPVIG